MGGSQPGRRMTEFFNQVRSGLSERALSIYLSIYLSSPLDTWPSLRSLRFLLFLSSCNPDSTIGPGQDQPHDSICQLQLMKVNDQPKRNVQKFHVAQKLRFLDGQNLLHTFEFQ